MLNWLKKLFEATPQTDFEKIEREVRKLANKYPNAIYQSSKNEFGIKTCFYNKGHVKNGPKKEGCIFGQALTSLGFHMDNNQNDITILCKNLGLNLYPEEKIWCCYVQSEQDSGSTWKEAVKNADDKRLNQRNS